ncbi:carbohydrate-binding domain-containing protein [Chryseobacterium fluminis]|uniref:carbohydrate-binding domain-containing protein n=1 Tax=Chryseobacterium fluminis TaxID=2983606 RepID=UPI00224E7EEC|nr:carbohydrate-binding domain-containing protein [Chryseobacterium sp. MMS21-Ot14]UZT97981.1 carbohydrate-binding domain-containing protein [Chryseobacterium sp. MMS21-Ot14]
MKKQFYLIIAILLGLIVKAQQTIVVHNSGNNMFASSTSVVDSIKLDASYSKFKLSGNTTVLDIPKTAIDSLTFTSNPVNLTKIYIIYKGTENATIINPYASQGVNITATAGTVNVVSTATISNLEYNLLGTSTMGSLTMSSTLPSHFVLNNVNITNSAGPAINITGGQVHTFSSQSGTNNSLIDGSGSTKNGALQTDGKIIFSGSGILDITGIKKHGVSTPAGIEVQSGTVKVIAAASDGFHSEGFTMDNGTVSITATADAIDAGDNAVSVTGGSITATLTSPDVKAIKTGTSTITISGGNINLSLTGAQSKAISAKGNITFGGGTVTATLSGAAVLTASGNGFDPSYSTAIKTDTNVIINSGTLNLNLASTANGGKGISAGQNITVNGGSITVTTAGNGATYMNTTGVLDSYSSSAVSADGNLLISAGTVTTTSSGTGGKGLKADGTVTIGSAVGIPELNITTTGTRFLVSGTDYSHPKTLVAAGAIIINNGLNKFTSTDDGIHSDASITVNGGTNTVSAISATSGVGEGVEAPIITFTGGVNNITASNDGINATYGTVSGGTEANDNSHLYISGGIVVVTGSDAIDSNGNITITGGTTIVNGPTSQPEEGIDFNGTFLMNGGLLISGGSNANMTKAMSTLSTQVGMYLKSSAQLAATSVFHIENAAGTEMVTFKPKNGVYYFHFSSPNLTQGTGYKVYFGGTYTGGSYIGGTLGWGLYTGGTYSTTGGTLKSTFTTSTTAKVNTVSF